MKIAILTLGFLGSCAVLAMGATLLIDIQRHRQSISTLEKTAPGEGAGAFVMTQMMEINSTSRKALLLLGLGFLSMGATLLALRSLVASGATLLLASFSCICVTPRTLVFSAPLVIAGGLAMFAGTKTSSRSLP